MVFRAYMLRCADGRYYTGHTDNLEDWIGQHQAGQGGYTSTRLPVTLAWSETFETRAEAIQVEIMVGGWSRAKKEALIAGDWRSISHLARPPKERPVLDQGFSTALETNGVGESSPNPPPFVSNEGAKPVETSLRPFVSSEVEKQPPGQPQCP